MEEESDAKTFVKILSVVLLIAAPIIALGMYGCPKYRVKEPLGV